MRIGIEAQRLLRPHKHGMDVVALETIRALARSPQHEYVVFVRSDSAREGLLCAPNVQVIELPGGPYPVWEQYVLPRALRRYGIDLLHCTANTAPLHCAQPRVLTLHDVIFLGGQPLQGGNWYQRLGNAYRRWNVPRIVPDCEQIVAVSNFERQRILDALSLDPARVATVHNGVSPRFGVIADTDQLDAVRRRYGLPAEFMLFMGNVEPRKNTRGLLMALEQLRHRGRLPIPLVISSLLPDQLAAVLLSIGHHATDRDIQLCGYIADADLPAVYNLATAFVYPSLHEGFGLPILEAMACGTPVLTSTVTAMPEVAGSAALLADPRSPDELAHQLRRLVNQSHLRADLRRRGLERAAMFSWGETANQLLGVYEAALTTRDAWAGSAYRLPQPAYGFWKNG